MERDRALQESLRAQGWGCQSDAPLPRKRDLEEEPANNVRG